MSAANELPHHGSADQAGPTENEHPHNLSPLWNHAHRTARYAIVAQRSLQLNIAMQQPRAEISTRRREEFSQLLSV
jgi:hypothetical protein